MSGAADTAGGALIRDPGLRRALVMVAAVMATGISALDMTIGTVALPHMRGSFSATIDQISWVLTSYIVAMAVTLPLTGWLGSRFGRKRVFVTAILGFTAASMLCGMAETLDQEVAFRTLQGMFGAPLVPLSQSLVLDAYPREQHGKALSIWGFGVTLGPIAGPLLGGYLTEHFGWPWIFYINLPLGLIAAFVAFASMTETERQPKLRLDWMGFLFLAVGIAMLQTMLDRGERAHWFESNEILIYAGLALLGFYLFVVHVTTTREAPFIRPDLFADRNFAVGMVMVFVFGFVLLPPLMLLPTFLDDLRGYPLTTIGLITAPRSVGVLVAMTLTGRILPYVDARWAFCLGNLVIAAGTLPMAGWNTEVGSWDVVWTGFVGGFGMGMVYVPLFTLSFSTLPAEKRMHSAGLFQLNRNLGSSVAVAIFASLLAREIVINRSELTERITRTREAIQTGLIPEGWSLDSLQGLVRLDAELTQQASMLAYANSFYLIALITLAAAPMAFLFKRPPKGGG